VVSGAEARPTARGETLWQFEALLRDRFARRPVFVGGGDFSSAGVKCGPLSQWSAYLFTFAAARGCAPAVEADARGDAAAPTATNEPPR
jgi:hypothetical protein